MGRYARTPETAEVVSPGVLYSVSLGLSRNSTLVDPVPIKQGFMKGDRIKDVPPPLTMPLRSLH